MADVNQRAGNAASNTESVIRRLHRSLYLNFDLGDFYFTFDDQVGEIILPNGFTSISNIGDARYIGFEAATELDVLTLDNGGAPSPYGNLMLYGNVTLLDAEFTSGPNNGNTPAYAPDYQVKTGMVYSYKNTFKVSLLGTLVDDEFGDDGDSFEGFIPAYNVWDLIPEFRFWKGRVGVFAGIRNVFDEDYWGRGPRGRDHACASTELLRRLRILFLGDS